MVHARNEWCPHIHEYHDCLCISLFVIQLLMSVLTAASRFSDPILLGVFVLLNFRLEYCEICVCHIWNPFEIIRLKHIANLPKVRKGIIIMTCKLHSRSPGRSSIQRDWFYSQSGFLNKPCRPFLGRSRDTAKLWLNILNLYATFHPSPLMTALCSLLLWCEKIWLNGERISTWRNEEGSWLHRRGDAYPKD